MADIAMAEIMKLSVSERIQLVEDIWDTLAAAPDGLDLSPDQQMELDRRIADYQANPDEGRPWSEVKARLIEGGVSAVTFGPSGSRKRRV